MIDGIENQRKKDIKSIVSAPSAPLDKQLFQNLLNSDIMKSDVVKQQLNMIKKNKVLDIHESAITAPKGSSSRWQTYLKKGENIRCK